MSESFWPRGRPNDERNIANYKALSGAPKRIQIIGDFIPPSIAWGGTIGFGWGVIRYMILGYTDWYEAAHLVIQKCYFKEDD